MTDKKSKEKSPKESAAPVQKNALEWSVFAVSLLLVLSSIGYLVRQILVTDDAPPHIVLKVGEPEVLQQAEGEEKGFVVSLEAINKGGQTAEGVHVEVEMQRGKEEPQAADFDIDFLPAGSSSDGYVAFKGSKENVKLEARVLGYEIP